MSHLGAPGFALFDTAIGRCGIAWSARGVTRLALPDPSDARLRSRLASGAGNLADGPGAAAPAEPTAGAAPARASAAVAPIARAVISEAPPPPVIADAIARITRHVAGEPDTLATIELDVDGVPAFHRAVYAALRRVPSGRTVSYGALAAALGKPGAARAIGQAMGKNPWPIIVPCHRVLAANRGAGGFSAPGGVTTKARLLAAEGVTLALQPELPFGVR